MALRGGIAGGCKLLTVERRHPVQYLPIGTHALVENGWDEN